MYDNDTEQGEIEELKVGEAVRKYERDERYTYADYASWSDDNRYELIDGVAYMMSAPSAVHQDILGSLYRQFADYLDDKPCRVFLAPFDVCLHGKGDDDDTVVQPDILVVCDETKLENGKYCNGAPDLIIEILSPSTARHDRIIKLSRYLKAGVREYWIVDPEVKGVNVFILENAKYIANAYEDTETIPVSVLDGCKIELPRVFEV